MHVLRRIWQDISRGENVDLYVIIAAAMVVTVLGLLNSPLKAGAQDLTPQITLAVLGLLAIGTLGNRYRLDRVLSARNPLTGMTGLNDWNDPAFYEAIKAAKSSIIIVESWFGSGRELAPHIIAAAQQAKTSLRVEVYVMDPTKPFGAQRVADLKGGHDENPEQWRDQFDVVLRETLSHLGLWHLDRYQVDLKVFTYDTLPVVRMYVIDHEVFFFSWFPLGRPAALVPCLRVSAREASGVSARLVQDLQDHLDQITKRAQPFDYKEG